MDWFTLLLCALPIVAFMFSVGDCCGCAACTTVRAITSWGANSTTIGQGATERNGNWEILTGLLRVTTADAIITWDAGISDWSVRFDTGSMSWDTPGSIVTDYSKELRFIFNWVDNSNYDYCSLRKTALDYLVSFGQRVGGVDTVILPVAGVGSVSKQFSLRSGSAISVTYKDEIIRTLNGTDTACAGGSVDPACNGRSWYRPRVNNIVGIGTGPSWTGNVDIGDTYITSPAASPCSSASDNCWYPNKPACGATNDIVANSLTVTLNGTPYTCYPPEHIAFFDYTWVGTNPFPFGPFVTLYGDGAAKGDLEIVFGSDSWLLTNAGSARTDADAWTSLNIPPVAPNVQVGTITGNY